MHEKITFGPDTNFLANIQQYSLGISSPQSENSQMEEEKTLRAVLGTSLP